MAGDPDGLDRDALDDGLPHEESSLPYASASSITPVHGRGKALAELACAKFEAVGYLGSPPSRNFRSVRLSRTLCGYEFERLCADCRSGRLMGLSRVHAAKGL
jgi:hypothetical protein